MAEIETAPERPVGLDPELIEAVRAAIERGAGAEAAADILSRPYADIADLLEALTPEERASLMPQIGRRLDPLVVSELNEEVREEVVELIGPAETAHVLQGLDTDDAAHIVESLDEDVQDEVLEGVREPERGLMTRADHRPFLGIGVPAVGFIFGYDPGSDAEKRYREWYNVRYHRPQDDITQPMDFAAAAKFNAFFYKLTETVADADSRARWSDTSPFKPK